MRRPCPARCPRRTVPGSRGTGSAGRGGHRGPRQRAGAARRSAGHPQFVRRWRTRGAESSPQQSASEGQAGVGGSSRDPATAWCAGTDNPHTRHFRITARRSRRGKGQRRCGDCAGSPAPWLRCCQELVVLASARRRRVFTGLTSGCACAASYASTTVDEIRPRCDTS